MTAELDHDDLEKIQALAEVIVEKVLDELAPDSEIITTSNLALGALACTLARSQLHSAALEQPT